MTSLPLQMDFPGRLIFGSGRLSVLPDELTRQGLKKALIISIHALDDELTPLVASLNEAGIEVQEDRSIVTEPSFSDVYRLLSASQSFAPDVVIGIGGGSVLDVAKLMAALIGNSQALPEIVGNGLLKSRSVRMICVPATSGTGSEASPNAILIDDTDGQKKGIISPFLVPDLVIVDPLLTVPVPSSVTAATGLDALTHCLEAYTNKFAKPFIDTFALDGIRRIAGHLVRAVQNGQDLEAREELSLGSLLGGFCLGPVNTAAVHALAYPLSTRFHVPHGMSNAVLLPHVMEFNIPAAPKRYADVARAMGVTAEGDDLDIAMAGVEKIREIMDGCKMPFDLQRLGVAEADLPQMAEDALKIQRLLVNNPREVTMADAIHIYQNAL